MPNTILLLGPPTLHVLQTSTDTLLDHVLKAFDPAPGQIRLEDFYGTAPLPTLSTFNPDESSRLDLGTKPPILLENYVPRPDQVPSRAIAWRVLSTEKVKLHTGFTQTSYMITPDKFREGTAQTYDGSYTNYGEQTSILHTGEEGHASYLVIDKEGGDGVNALALLEDSFAANNAPLSQLEFSTLKSSSTPHPTASSRANDSYEELPTAEDVRLHTIAPILPHIPLSLIHEIEDLPPAEKVAVARKMPIITLLVGIISISEAKTIATKNAYEDNPSGFVKLITVMVGDESASGFEVKVWVNIAPGVVNPVESLRRGDIVLFEMVGLSEYKGTVYGSTLRGGRTKIMLVYRDNGQGARLDAPGQVEDQQVVKVRQMREWVRNYVGKEEISMLKDENVVSSRALNKRPFMPDDTQDTPRVYKK